MGLSKDSCDDAHIEVADIAPAAHVHGVDHLPVSWFVWLVAITASLAGFLFGYDTGIISAVLVYLKDDLNNRPTTSNEKQLITSLCSGGAFFGAILAGLTADKVWFSYPYISFVPQTNCSSSVAKPPSIPVAPCLLSGRSFRLLHIPSPKCPLADL